MLATLALAAPRRVSVDDLIASVWGASPPRTAAKTLQTYVLHLRRILEPGLLITVSGGYALNIQPDQIDARRFERLVGSGHDAMVEGDPQRAASFLRDALTLWRDDPLIDIAGTHAAHVVRLNELAANATETLFDARLALGESTALIPLLEDAVGEHPLREHRWAQLMIALHRAGRTADALRAYQRARSMLADELGLEPGAELRAAEESILHSTDQPLVPDITPDRGPTDLPAPLVIASAAPWVGRDDLCSELIEIVSSGLGTESTSPRLITVTGDAGIGKTRLAAAVAEHVAARGAFVLYGRCDDGLAMPYQPFVDAIDGALARVSSAETSRAAAVALAHLLPRFAIPTSNAALSSQLPVGEAAARTMDGIAQLLAGLATARPVLLVLDDLHWADRATAAVITHLSTVIAARPVVVLGLSRRGELGPDHPVTGSLGQLGRIVGSHQQTLGPLDDRSIAGFVAIVTGLDLPAALLEEVVGTAEGNPLFARELALDLAENWADHRARNETDSWGVGRSGPPVPATIRAVVIHRYQRLGPDARRLLAPAVVHDGLFMFETVRTVAGLDEARALDALDELLEARIVDPGPRADIYKVSHDLLRAVLYTDLSSSRQLRLHRRVAEQLILAGDDALPAEIARHYLLSRELAGAHVGAEFALSAARFAEQSGAFNESVEQLHVALSLAEPDGLAHAAALTSLPVAFALAGRWDDVPAAMDVACGLLAERGEPLAAAQLALDVVNATIGMGNARLGWALARVGLGFVGGERNLVWAELRSLAFEAEDALNPTQPGVPIEHPDRRQAARLIADLSAKPWHSELVAMSAEDRTELLVLSRNFPGAEAFWCGEYAASVEPFERLANEALAIGHLGWATSCLANAARCRIALGQFDLARVGLDKAHAVGDRLGAIGTHFMNLLAADDEMSSAMGDGWLALKDVGGAGLLDTSDPAHRSALAAFFASGSRIFAHDGAAQDESLAFASAVVPYLAAAPGWAINFTRMACDVAEALWFLDRGDDIDIVEAALRDKVIAPDYRYPMVDGYHALGRLLGVRRQFDDAMDAFGVATRRLAEQRAWPLQAVVQFDEALLLQRMGFAAADRFAKAALRFEESGMPGWAARAHRQRGALNGVSHTEDQLTGRTETL